MEWELTSMSLHLAIIFGSCSRQSQTETCQARERKHALKSISWDVSGVDGPSSQHALLLCKPWDAPCPSNQPVSMVTICFVGSRGACAETGWIHCFEWKERSSMRCCVCVLEYSLSTSYKQWLIFNSSHLLVAEQSDQTLKIHAICLFFPFLLFLCKATELKYVPPQHKSVHRYESTAKDACILYLQKGRLVPRTAWLDLFQHSPLLSKCCLFFPFFFFFTVYGFTRHRLQH